jgi:acylphosphatase
MEPDCSVKIIIRGRVQGVGFRFATFQLARSLELTGFVKNLPDDSVYIEAQGSPDSVDYLLQWCKSGPARAVVESTEVTMHPPAEFKKFQIR